MKWEWSLHLLVNMYLRHFFCFIFCYIYHQTRLNQAVFLDLKVSLNLSGYFYMVLNFTNLKIFY